jgi:hypothetical protein
MTLPPDHGDVQISHVHNWALCAEIGERLGIRLANMPIGVPPHLVMLMKRLSHENSEPIVCSPYEA